MSPQIRTINFTSGLGGNFQQNKNNNRNVLRFSGLYKSWIQIKRNSFKNQAKDMQAPDCNLPQQHFGTSDLKT